MQITLTWQMVGVKRFYFNNKTWKKFNYPEGIGVSEKDYLRLDEINPIKWQSSGGMAHSYGYDRTEDDKEKYKSVEALVETLIDVVSKNGNFLLDIGPKPNGEITALQKERLLGIGKWLNTNGEAIYGTRSWDIHGYDNIRFTKKENVLYIICLDNPVEAFQVKYVKKLNELDINSIELLGSKEQTIKWEYSDEKLSITPPKIYKKDHAIVFKVTYGK